jgi:hypothetical protein
MIHTIEFGPKFCQAQFDFVLREDIAYKDADGNIQKTSHWKRSFSPDVKEVVFDLTLTEWVATEQIAFLFAWLRNLKYSGKFLKVYLPFRNNIENYLTKLQLQKISENYKDTNGNSYIDNIDRIKRRRRSSAFLMAVYGLFTQTGLEESDFINMADPGTYFKESERLRKNNHQIIPFTPFDLSANRQHIKYDTHFYDVINNNMYAQAKTSNIFDLQKNIQQLLKDYACYTPFESKILSNVVTQELYINSLQHSFVNKNDEFLIPECYITAFLSNKWNNPESENFIPSFLEEKLPESLDFFKDKDKILKKINKSLKLPKHKDIKPREADLGSFNEFKNISYLEYTFLDFGEGIHNSIETEFKRVSGEGNKEGEKAINELLNNPDLSDGFKSANKHSQMLEYAFLMDTSKNPLDKNIEYYELVPRGLYFLIDMVRRYKGLLVVRSGNGKLIYDFSDRIIIENKNSDPVAIIKNTYSIKNAVKFGRSKDSPFFPGTIFTIILPEKLSAEKQNDNTVIPAVRIDSEILSNYAYSLTDKHFILSEHPKEFFHPNAFEYVSILFLYNNIIEQLKQEENEIHVKDIYNRLFYEINKILNYHKDNNCIVFFDFAGLRTGNASWIKILYYLMLTPKINEVTKAIIVNLPSDEDKIIKDLKENNIYVDIDGVKKKTKIPEPYLYKPIPCINFRIDASKEEDLIEWIGLKDRNDEVLLTQLLLGRRKDNYPTDIFKNPKNTEGSLFVKINDRVYPTFSGLDNLRVRFTEVQKMAVAKFLKKYIESGYDEAEQKELYVYLTSNGGYQFKYLSLYELLHDKYVARYFAKSLLDKYCSFVRENVLKGEKIRFYRFTKIIAVTVSSQLIGVAIRDLIEEDDNYTFLRKEEKESGGSDSAPDLIMLSSYYSFETEKPFEKIESEDRVLIVNDVISTGSLVGQLLTKIEEIKEAMVSGVFSIADTRIPLSEIETQEEIQSVFFGAYENYFFTLSAYDDGIELRKYKVPYCGNAIAKRINPLLNTIVELKAYHGEQDKILFPEANEIVDDINIEAHFFKVGHFQQNLTHNGYLTDMRPLFASDTGIYIIEKLKAAIEERYSKISLNKANEIINIRFVNIEKQLNSIKSIINQELYNIPIDGVHKSLEELKERIFNDESIKLHKKSFNPDFIFYPVFSGIEKMSHFKLSNIFNTHPDNIIGLQRFDTPKGWRFPFPAKRFNELTKGKSILILDSGSLTGESLVQLIDNIGFLDVKEIVVLSVIVRIEDFYREFYSRLKSIKVKRLKSKEEKKFSQSANKTYGLAEEVESIVPIEILFGINLHIPVFSSSVSCPFCDELKYLTNILEIHKPIITNEVIEYIKFRRIEIKELHTSKDKLINISYLPIDNSKKEVDTKGIFITRDLLGKIDSYRFYPDYFKSFVKLQDNIKNTPEWFNNESIKKEIELILICILHEPYLLDLVKNYLASFMPVLKEYVLKRTVNGNFDTSQLYYTWSIYSLMRLSYLFLKNAFFSIKNFEKILSVSDKKSKLFLHFKFWELLYLPSQKEDDKKALILLLREFNDNYSAPIDSELQTVYTDANREFVRLHTNQLSIVSLQDYLYLDLPFENLSNFVYKGENKARHFELIEKLNDLFFEAGRKGSSLNSIRESANKVIDILDKDLKPSLIKISNDKNFKIYFESLHHIYTNNDTGVLYLINKLETEYNKIKDITELEIFDYQSVIDKISVICDKFINRTLSNDDKKDNFYKISKLFPCNIYISLMQLATRFEKENCLKIAIANTENVAIRIHKYLLDEILKEIIKNAKNAYPESLEIYIRYEVIIENTLQLHIWQNKPYKAKEKNGGQLNLVQYYIDKFKGNYSDNSLQSLESGEDYIITINIPTFQAKQEDSILVDLF